MHKPGEEKRAVVIVVLRPDDWEAWLTTSNVEAARSMLRLYPAVGIMGEPAWWRGCSWTTPPKLAFVAAKLSSCRVDTSMDRNEKRAERPVFASVLAERGGFEPPIGD